MIKTFLSFFDFSFNLEVNGPFKPYKVPLQFMPDPNSNPNLILMGNVTPGPA